MSRKLIDLTGQRFGKWIVLERTANDAWGVVRWLCRCDCGRERIVYGNNLKKGESKGCKSCHTKRIKTTHGQWRTRLYYVWMGMIRRCENAKRKDYKDYGGRGISVCSEWHDAATFLKWAMANGYKEGLQIDRIDNDGDYEPSNCRFVTRTVQGRNTRKDRHIKIGNEVKLLIEWAELSGINKTTLWQRINAGWPENRLLEPVHK